jgi:hypothetical protein
MRGGKLIGRLVLVLVAVLPVHAQPPEAHYTHGFFNCRWWLASDHLMKLGYVSGFAEGTTLASDKDLNVVVSSKVTFGEYERGVDQLCAAPENATLPVYEMIFIFTKKFQGVPAATINSLMEWNRKYYNQPPPDPPPQKTGGAK